MLFLNRLEAVVESPVNSLRMMLEHEIDKIILESINHQLSRKTDENRTFPCKQHNIFNEHGQMSSVSCSVEGNDRGVGTEALSNGEISPHEGRCFAGQIVCDIMEIISKFKVAGGASCSNHPLHEASYRCINCNDGGPICLICFAENHVGHVIQHSSGSGASMPTSGNGVTSKSLRTVQLTTATDDSPGAASNGQEYQKSAPQHSSGGRMPDVRQDVERNNSNENGNSDPNYEDNGSGGDDDEMRSIDDEPEPDLSRFTERLVEIGVDPVRMPIKEEEVDFNDLKSRPKKKSTEKEKSKPSIKYTEVKRSSRNQRKRQSESIEEEDDEEGTCYPAYSRKETTADRERENKWDQHFYALLNYGLEHQTKDGHLDYNVPKEYTCGEGDDKLLLGAWVKRLDFRCMSDERYTLLSSLAESGDFSICFKGWKGQSAQGNEDTSSSSSSFNKNSNSQSQSKGKESHGGTASNGSKALQQIERQLMRIKSEAPSSSSQTKNAPSSSSTATKITPQEQEQEKREQELQRDPLPRQNKSHDKAPTRTPNKAASQTSSPISNQSQSKSQTSKTAAQQPRSEPDSSAAGSIESSSVRIWRSLMPTPSDLKSRTCIVHYQKKKSKSGELKKVVVFGQVKEDVGEDCSGFSPVWKIGTNAMEALDLSDLSNSGFKINVNAKSQRDVKVGEILLHGLILAEGEG